MKTFFFRLKKNNIKITDISENIFVEHYPEQSENYSVNRARFLYFIVLSCKKNNFKKIIIQNDKNRFKVIFASLIYKIIPKPFIKRLIKITFIKKINEFTFKGVALDQDLTKEK